ncbi:MAG: chemotaxis protein CheD [Cyclobacteriaceae bacterium]
MIDSEVQIGKHYLYPSSIFVSADPFVVTTVLGSCISVCLFDTKNMIGGINHFMLPLWNGEGLASAKYGNVAMERLIEEMKRKGAKRENIKAKMFGGANLVNLTMNVGERNAELAKKILGTERIELIAESIGGARGRKILFDTNTGVVKMRYIQQTHDLRHKI